MNFENKKIRLAVLASHPSEYLGPLLKELAKRPEIDLSVYFCWRFGAGKEMHDPGFGRKIKWDIPLTEGYNFKFLRNFSPKPSSSMWWGEINPGIVKELTGARYDVILVHGWNYFTSWLAFLTSFITKTPILLHGENPLNQELLKSRLKRKIKKVILGWFFKRVTAFLYIGEENKKFYKYYGVPEEKLYFVPYAVDNGRFIKEATRLVPQRIELRKGFGVAPERMVILFMGKLIQKKRPFDLLKAYELLTTAVALVFVGDGVLRKKLEEYVEEHDIKRVHFMGFRNLTELSAFYVIADIFVLPSGAGETWGVVVNEAMCFGLPVIVSDIVGCGPDLIRENENGFAFPTGDTNALANRLEALVQDKALRHRLGAASRKIIGNYSFEKDIEGILTAIRRTLH